MCQTVGASFAYLLLCATLFIVTDSKKDKHVVKGHEDIDDPNFDPYTSMDPKLREPSPCEVCKYFVNELSSRLAESANSKEVIETGHGLDRKKRFNYRTSELRLTEALVDPHICENILNYNVHAERKGSLRYAKGQSETMSTLHGLVNKGVKVDLGIPHDLWDKPSAEVSKMHRACFKLSEDHEDDIEDWYYNKQDEDLAVYLCAKRYLPRFPEGKFHKECLAEMFDANNKNSFREELRDDEENEEGKEKGEKKKSGKKKKKSTKKNSNRKGDKGTEDAPPPQDVPQPEEDEDIEAEPNSAHHTVPHGGEL